MASPNLNNTNLTSAMNSWTSTDWSNFATDIGTNWLTAWSSRFTLSSRQSTALALVPAALQNQFANSANYVAAGITSGYILDAVGSAVDWNPTGTPSAAKPVHVSIGVCITWDPIHGLGFDITITVNTGD